MEPTDSDAAGTINSEAKRMSGGGGGLFTKFIRKFQRLFRLMLQFTKFCRLFVRRHNIHVNRRNAIWQTSFFCDIPCKAISNDLLNEIIKNGLALKMVNISNYHIYTIGGAILCKVVTRSSCNDKINKIEKSHFVKISVIWIILADNFHFRWPHFSAFFFRLSTSTKQIGSDNVRVPHSLCNIGVDGETVSDVLRWDFLYFISS